MSKHSLCYQCKHRGGVPGSAHSSCRHPDIKPTDDPLIKLISLLGGGVGIDFDTASKFGIKANAHGIRSGWFNWPWNFDPVWLDACEKFDTRKEQDNAG